MFGKRGISLNNKFHSSGAGVKLAHLQIGMLDGMQLPKKAKLVGVQKKDRRNRLVIVNQYRIGPTRG